MKAFASDFDGTIYFSEKSEHVKASDIQAVHKFQEQGHLFGFCTGRPIYGVTDYIKEYIEADFYITNSGATIHDKDLNLIYEKTIPKEIIDKLITYGVKNSYAVDLHMAGKFYADGKATNFIKDILTSLDEIHGNVHNISYNALTEEAAIELVQLISHQFGDQIAAFRNTRYVDIVPFGCSKGTGIEIVRKVFQIDTFCGIGDSMNDLPMLEKADMPFTFPFAPEALQEKSKHIVNSVAEALDFML